MRRIASVCALVCALAGGRAGATTPGPHTAWTEPGDLPQLAVDVGGERLPLPLLHTDIRAELTGTVARVEVTQSWWNPLDRPVEAEYAFVLPENAAVDGLQLQVGDRLLEATIRRRGEARRAYARAHDAGHTAALLEQDRPGRLRQAVTNLPPGEDVDTIVRYVQDLSVDGDTWEFVAPLVQGPRQPPGEGGGAADAGDGERAADGDRAPSGPHGSGVTPSVVGEGERSGRDVTLTIVVDGGLPVADFDTPGHAVDAVMDEGDLILTLAAADRLPNHDFVLRLRRDGPAPRAAVQAYRPDPQADGFFTLVVQPPSADLGPAVGQRELVFVVDVSGSMSGWPVRLAQHLAREAVLELRPTDTFDVLVFSDRTERAFRAPRPANRANVAEALAFLGREWPAGGTELGAAVREALGPPLDGERDRVVIVLTDAQYGPGEEVVADIEHAARHRRPGGRRSRLFAWGVGDVDRPLIEAMSRAGGGTSAYFDRCADPGEAVGALFRSIDAPVLTDVRVDWGALDVTDIETGAVPDLLASRPFVLHGRYRAPGAATVVLSGERDGRRIELPVPVVLPERRTRGDALATLWARARIDRLTPLTWRGERDAAAAIEALGLSFGIVTPYTSFLAVDEVQRVGAAGAVADGYFTGTGAALSSFEGTALAAGDRGVRLHDRSQRVVVTGHGVRVRGGLAAETVSRYIRMKMGQVRWCYKNELQRDPALAGELTLFLVVAPTGKVVEFEVEEGTLGQGPAGRAVAACVRQKAAMWRFPAAPDGRASEVRYPFFFRALPQVSPEPENFCPPRASDPPSTGPDTP